MTSKIICPHCGAEYLLEEIFMSEDILGTRMPIKDSKGKIVNFEGSEPELCAEYICDYCDRKFTTTLTIEATSNEEEQDLWDEEYSVEIFKDRIDLEE